VFIDQTYVAERIIPADSMRPILYTSHIEMIRKDNQGSYVKNDA